MCKCGNHIKLVNCLSHPYHFIITEITDESGKYFVARVPELDGLIGTGDTYEEAYDDIKEAMVSYFVLIILTAKAFIYQKEW